MDAEPVGHRSRWKMTRLDEFGRPMPGSTPVIGDDAVLRDQGEITTSMDAIPFDLGEITIPGDAMPFDLSFWDQPGYVEE